MIDGSPIKIELLKIPKDQIKPGQQECDIRCISTVEKDISARQTEQFESLSDHSIPEGIRIRANEIIDELRAGLKKGVRVFMWKRGLFQVYNFLKPTMSDLQYSFDGNSWKMIRAELKLGFSRSIAPKSSEETECNKLLLESYSQPLGHELLSEAWSLSDDSIRSSLVIGIAAAETGFKECVHKLMPDAGWLITNIPSPPLVKMIKEYLPTFKTELKLNGKVLSLPKRIIDILVTGVNLRNDISHGKASMLEQDTVTKILSAVQDLLYLLDFYCGQPWALSKIRIAILDEMKAESANSHK